MSISEEDVLESLHESTLAYRIRSQFYGEYNRRKKSYFFGVGVAGYAFINDSGYFLSDFDPASWSGPIEIKKKSQKLITEHLEALVKSPKEKKLHHCRFSQQSKSADPNERQLWHDMLPMGKKKRDLMEKKYKRKISN